MEHALAEYATLPNVVMLILATQLIVPFSRWAAEKLVDKNEGEQTELKIAVAALGKKLDERFDQLKDLLSQQHARSEVANSRLNVLETEAATQRTRSHELADEIQAVSLRLAKIEARANQ